MKFILIAILTLCIQTMTKSVYDMTEEEFKAILKPNKPEKFHFIPNDHNPIYGAFPHNYDARTLFPSCIHPVRNQGQCGSCWAFAITGALSDRFCIKSPSHTIDVVLSPQMLVSCDSASVDQGCNGGEGKNGMEYATTHGLVSEECYPYTSGVTTETGTCLVTAACTDSSVSYKLYKCKDPGPKSYEKNDVIMQEIMDNGPVFCEYAVYADFKEYKSGIYYQSSKDLLGLHDIKIIGWGVENGVNYWLCQNSWGADWGENGFFRIRMGSAGMCAIAWACEPDV